MCTAIHKTKLAYPSDTATYSHSGKTRPAFYLHRVTEDKDWETLREEVARMNSDYRNEDAAGYDTFELVGCQIVGTWHEKETGRTVEMEWFFAKCECGCINTYAGGNDDTYCFGCDALNVVESRVTNRIMKALRK